ncbi:tRNA-modifying protein YgfZ [Arsukibacterium sp.]|uniref:tRNA-modifying protein YgfZ n=1 Tax=Arsukibacterium sp. TaxID=1977258 RepID=UPI002FD90BEC
MHTSWLTAEQYARLSNQVQGAYLCPLPGFEVLRVNGADNRSFLQGQTTCDLNQLTDDRFLRGAHCDVKGKMWSIFHLCAAEDALLLVAHREELQASVPQWKKFGVFAKVSFDDSQQVVFGLGGEQATQLAAELGFSIPANDGGLSRSAAGCLLRLAQDHHLLIVPRQLADSWLTADYPLAAPPLWLRRHIQLGFSYLEQPLCGQLVPQMLNLQALDAISFTKGCYIGQETVARLKYRGGNKRAAFILCADSDEQPAAGAELELKLEQHWRRIGQVINAVNINNQLWLIAVLPNDITPADTLRLAADTEVTLSLQPLPYAI